MAGATHDRALGRARSGRRHRHEAEIAFAFAETYRMLNARISIFVSLPMRSLDQLSLQKRLDEIGKTKDGGASPASAA